MNWTPERDAILREQYPNKPSRLLSQELGTTLGAVYRRAGVLGLKKTADFLNSIDSGRITKPNHATQFKKGFTPHNKGKSFIAGGRSAETRFKKGEIQGRAAQLMQQIGAERITKDGYIQRKINNDMPNHKRWRGVHLLNWEAVNGPLPKGHAIAFKDGNKQNPNIENLELVTRQELMRRNSYHTTLPPEMRSIVQLRSAIKRKINRIEKEHQHANTK